MPAHAGSGEPKEQICWVTRSVEKESGREPGQETNDPGVAQDKSPYAIEKSVSQLWLNSKLAHSSQRELTL